MTTHGYALNVDLDPAPFTEWITACGLEDAAFTTIARELGRPVTSTRCGPHAAAALEDVFELELEELPGPAVALACVTTARLETFADGVFAIAATLLILNVDAQVSGDVPDLGAQLAHIWPSYLAYAVSFVRSGSCGSTTTR